jgi:competence protein ComEC
MTIDLLSSQINELLPEPQASLVLGMLFGIRASMPEDFYEALITTGTIHMIALSGMNVSIIVWLLFEGLGRYFGKWTRIMVTLGGIVGFVLLVGAGPTIVRASIMGTLGVLAALVGRKSIPLLSLVIASIVMIAFDTEVLGDISFQLSFLATFGIILFAKKREHSMALQPGVNTSTAKPHYFVELLKSDLRVTLAAQVFTLPLIFWYFGRISLISPIANIAVGWLVAPIMYLVMATIVMSIAFKPLGYLLSFVLWVPVTIFIWVINLLSKMPFASVSME